MRLMKFYIVIIASCIVLFGCGKQNTNILTDENSEKDDTSYQVIEISDDGDCDNINVPTLDTANRNMSNCFDLLQGEWQCEGKTIRFYTEDNYYKYDDGTYNCNVVITSLSIDDNNMVEILVGGGSEQCRILGELSEDGMIFSISGDSYKYVNADEIIESCESDMHNNPDNGKQFSYDTEYDYVLKYLHDTYGGDYTIKECDFQQYDYGITGGQFIYSFEIEDREGTKYNAHYMRLQDISEDTVLSLKFEPIE